MQKSKDHYIPALGHDRLTSLYDPVVRLTTREASFKAALLRQARIQAGHRVLDLGCGTATLLILIKQAHPHAEAIGIDGDPAILKQARVKARQAGLEIQFDEGLSDRLPYADKSFDRIMSSLFFHHLTRENKLRTLAEVRRVLKPGGELHIADWGTPQNRLMRAASYFIRLLDGFEATADNFNGLLPTVIKEAGLVSVEEKRHYNSLFGTIRLLRAKRGF